MPLIEWQIAIIAQGVYYQNWLLNKTNNDNDEITKVFNINHI